MQRLITELAAFHFVIRWISGATNKGADILSRYQKVTGKQLHDDLERGQTYADMEKIDLIIGRNVESESFEFD